jgi:hypothetical protein
MGSTCCDGRRFAVTENNMMAIVPRFTEIGDEVCLVSGAQKPVLLRVGDEDENEKGGRWRVVGDCYVHGIMDGELWDGGNGARVLTIY